MSSTVDKRSVALELAALGTAALLFVATFRVRPPYVDLALAVLAVTLIVATARRSTRLWQHAPPRAACGVLAPALLAAAFTLPALGALAALAAVDAATADESTLERFANWHFFLAVPIYFLWAVLQQYIFQFYFLGRLLHIVPQPVAIALTAAAFASVHFPRWPVVAVTFLAGLYWTWLYLRYRNLWVLAVSHALLGAALHYWVFGRDLLAGWLAGPALTGP
jgi:membrane protease YdiL (CAAX protease family)